MTRWPRQGLLITRFRIEFECKPPQLLCPQERQMRESYEKHKEGPHCVEGIATDLEFRFTRAQIRYEH